MFIAAEEAFMDASKASRTAEIMARYRAAELRFPEEQRICKDPYAIYFVSDEVKKLLKRPLRLLIIRLWLNWMFPGIHNGVVSRVRYMDDCVVKCLENDLEQLVIIGAGYDTRAYRIEGIAEKVKVFELDHPATQRAKKETLKVIFDSPPGHVTHIPIHLDKDRISEKLSTGGYDPAKKTLFIMEGLLMYLPPRFVDKLFKFIKTTSGAGSWVTFDYLPPSMIDGTIKVREGKNMIKGVKKWGEPFRFGLKHEDAKAFLSSRGFCNIDTVNAPDLKATYFDGKIRGKVDVSTVFSFAFAEV
jgi:methyltransferase (TIGR00027 family)